jgi:hypothetical protein
MGLSDSTLFGSMQHHYFVSESVLSCLNPSTTSLFDVSVVSFLFVREAVNISILAPIVDFWSVLVNCLRV